MLNKIKNRGNTDMWEWLLAIALILLVVTGAYWFMSWLLMWGWNVVMPQVFGLPVITQWMSFAMIVVGSIIGSLFKSNTTVSK